MKLPRWLVIAMLTTSVLAVLAAAGWWWVTSPERTAREFVDLMAQSRFDEAAKLAAPELAVTLTVLHDYMSEQIRTGHMEMVDFTLPASFNEVHVLQPRTWFDLLQGRLTFSGNTNSASIDVKVSKGTVKDFVVSGDGEGTSYSELHKTLPQCIAVLKSQPTRRSTQKPDVSSIP